MISLRSLEQRFIALRTELARKQGQRDQLELQHQLALREGREAGQRRELYEKTVELLLKASGEARELAKSKIEHLVTLGLQAVTDEPYAFRMDMVQSAGQWTVQFVVISPDGIELDPIDSCGGGITDIVSMTLQIAILQMYEPTVEGPILLDEKGKYISRNYMRTFVDFLRTLTEKTGRQIVLVTHTPELAAGADRIFEVTPEGKTSTITDVTTREDIL